MSENPIPKPTVRSATGSSWEASDVRAVLCNPVNVGLGPFKQIVPEDLWLKGAEKQVAEHGPEQFLVNVLFMLKDSFKRVQGSRSILSFGRTGIVGTRQPLWCWSIICCCDRFCAPSPACEPA